MEGSGSAQIITDPGGLKLTGPTDPEQCESYSIWLARTCLERQSGQKILPQWRQLVFFFLPEKWTRHELHISTSSSNCHLTCIVHIMGDIANVDPCSTSKIIEAGNCTARLCTFLPIFRGGWFGYTSKCWCTYTGDLAPHIHNYTLPKNPPFTKNC
jgi:hypothetical protein